MIDDMDNQGTLYKYVRGESRNKEEKCVPKEGGEWCCHAPVTKIRRLGLWPGGLPTVTLLPATCYCERPTRWGGVDLLHTHGHLYPLR